MHPNRLFPRLRRLVESAETGKSAPRFSVASPFLRRALMIAFATCAVLVAVMLAPRGSAAADHLPACRIDDVPAVDAGYADWASTLLDTTYRLPAGYEPPDLVPVGRAGLDGGGSVRSFVIADLRDMVEAAAHDGIELRAVSAYRSEETQAGLLAQAEASSATETALALVSRPGHSEHELGTTLDLGSANGAPPWSWLAENGWHYGFVLSYPADKSPATTCYAYEPWHLRYFGRQRAAEIHASGLSTREFLWRLLPASVASGSDGGQENAEVVRPPRSGAQPSRGQSQAPDAPAANAHSPSTPLDSLEVGVTAAGASAGLLVLWRRRRPRQPILVRDREHRPRP